FAAARCLARPRPAAPLQGQFSPRLLLQTAIQGSRRPASPCAPKHPSGGSADVSLVVPGKRRARFNSLFFPSMVCAKAPLDDDNSIYRNLQGNGLQGYPHPYILG